MNEKGTSVKSYIRAMVALGVLALAMACGGGGGGGSASSDAPSGDRLKASFSPKSVYNALDGDELFIYKLGERTPILEVEDLASVTGLLEVTFELDSNYLLVVQRLGVINFLSTLITDRQINDARKTGILRIGELNSVTTLLSHRLDATSDAVPNITTAEIDAEVGTFFEGVTAFSDLPIRNLVSDTVTKKDVFYESFANRANAMTAFSALMYLKKQESLETNVELTQEQIDGYVKLHNAILTGTVEDWTNAAKEIGEDGVLPVFNDSRMSFNDENASDEIDAALRNLGIVNKMFTSDDSGLYVVDVNDLHNIFYEPETAEDSFLFDLAVETIPNSVISGFIDGPGAAGAEIYLYRPSRSHDAEANTGFIMQSTTSADDGSFTFDEVPSDDEYRVFVKKPGYLYKAGTVLNKAGETVVNIDSFALDGTTIVLNDDDEISLADGAVTSDKLASTISIDDLSADELSADELSAGRLTAEDLDAEDLAAGNLVVNSSANINGMVFPTGDGLNGQVLVTDGDGQLSFTTLNLGTQVHLDQNETISGDWDNTDNPWADNEVSNILTIDGGTVDGSPVGSTTPSTGDFTDLTSTSFELNGMSYPTADGTANQVLSTDGAGSLRFMSVSISNDGQTYTNAEVSSGNVSGNIMGATISSSTIDSTPIGATVAASGEFTDLTAATLTATGANLNGLLMPTTDGAANQVLSTDGSGNLTFMSVSISNDSQTYTNAEIASGNFSGNISGATISSSTLDSTPIGGSSPAAGEFTDLTAATLTATGANLNGLLMPTADGTANQVLSTDGSGNLTFMSVSISNDSQTYTNAEIASGNFSGNISGATISSSTLDSTPIGGSSPAAGEFTDLTAATLTATGANLNGLLMPTADGTANQVLSTDGSGNLTFMSVSISNDSQTYTNAEIASGNFSGNIDGATITASSMTGSTIDSTTIGATGASSGNFTTLRAGTSLVASGANLNGLLYPTTDGTANQLIGTDGSGTLSFITVSNDSQTFKNAEISSGNFTGNVLASVLSDTSISASNFSGNIDSSPIGATVGSTGNFTILTAVSANVTDDLHVMGSANVSDNLTVVGSTNLAGLVFPTVDGSANQLLITGGNGFLSFASTNTLLNGATPDSISIEGGSIDDTPIGAVTPSTGAFTTLASDSLTVSEDISATGNITASENLNTLHLTVTGNTTLGDDFTSDNLTIESTVDGGSTAGGNIWFQGNLISSTNTYSLGTESNPWREIYAIDLITTSDERLKKDVEPLDYGIDEVMKLKPVSYNWKNQPNRGRTIGLLAQEVESVIEEVVAKAENEEETRGVRYVNMVPVLIRAMQEQQALLEKQSELLKLQSERIEALENQDR